MSTRIEEIHEMDSRELRSKWSDPNEDQFSREECLWEYWRRVAVGELPFSREEFLEALGSNNTRIADVVGLLAERDALVGDLLRAASDYASTQPDGKWLSDQLNARSMLRRLRAEGTPNDDDVCEALVAKGTSWAALEAVSLLGDRTLQELLNFSEKSRVFTKGQRHELRTRVGSHRRKLNRGH